MAHVRTWVFDDVDQLITAQGTTEATQKAVFLALKNSLKNVPGCTVLGSSDSVTGAVDTVDRWVDVGDLVFDSAGNAHSWIALYFTGTDSILVIDLSTNTAQANFFHGSGSGIGSGSTTSGPAVTYELLVKSWVEVGAVLPQASDGHLVLHVLYTDDGEQVRVVVMRENVVVGLMMFGLAESPNTGWTSPHVWFGIRWRDGADVATDNIWLLDSYCAVYNTADSSSPEVYVTVENWDDNGYTSWLDDPDLWTSRYQLWSQGLYGNTPVYVGRIADQFWAPDGFTGEFFESVAGDLYACFGNFAFPWSGTTIVRDDSGPYTATVYDADLRDPSACEECVPVEEPVVDPVEEEAVAFIGEAPDHVEAALRRLPEQFKRTATEDV